MVGQEGRKTLHDKTKVVFIDAIVAELDKNGRPRKDYRDKMHKRFTFDLFIMTIFRIKTDLVLTSFWRRIMLNTVL